MIHSLIAGWRRGARLLLLGLSVGLAGCAQILNPMPAPEFFDDIEALFTTDIPAEQPLPPLHIEGLSEEDIRAARIYRDNHRAVVNVTNLSAIRTRFFGTFPSTGTGSGFIIDRRGIVVTNHHVIAGAQRLVLTLYDGSRYPAIVVGSDPEMDLAVLRFDPLGRRLPVINTGDSSRLQVGHRLFALGNPFGLEGTLTSGVVSALNRPVQLESGFIIRDLIQHDAAINPGSSGGPLLDSGGRLVGVNSLMISPSTGNVGIGMAIPVDSARRIVNHILAEGSIARGWIDIEGMALTPRLAANLGIPGRQGILITQTIPDGNAARAGLRDGAEGRHVLHGLMLVPAEADVLVAINGEAVRSVAELFASLEATRPGEDAVLTVLRQGQTLDIPLQLGARPD